MQGKCFWAIVAGSGPAAEAQPLCEALQLTAGYMALSWGGYLYGNGARPGDVRRDAAAGPAAKHFLRKKLALLVFQRFCRATGPAA